MQKELDLFVSPREAADENLLKTVVARVLRISESRIMAVDIQRRSIDARSKMVKIMLNVQVYVDEHPKMPDAKPSPYRNVHNSTPVIVVGSGPAGLFAALQLLEHNLKPIVLERGVDVHTRKRHIATLHISQQVNPDSNYSFGEGGAGTFSDGKLYTRSKKRGNVQKIMETFRAHGASNDIMVDTHPHIGTDKLPAIIRQMRETIEAHGGQVLFGQRVVDLYYKAGKLAGVQMLDGNVIEGAAVVLATGHSARDIFEILTKNNLQIEAKGFAMGVRVEHPQSLIDYIQYHNPRRNPWLPSATYSLVNQSQDRGVYSFCMCPGGFIVPAATAPGEIVVNGMSPSHRNSKWANSGIVVEIRLEDIPNVESGDPLAGLKYQKYFEGLAFANGGGGLIAPAQRMVDFVENRVSVSLPKPSYTPGLVSSPMHEWIPEYINTRLRESLQAFGKHKYGYYSNEAVIVGVESRTSSPVKVPRLDDAGHHPQCPGLFPAGEGSGYAGGIVSSAMDGMAQADKLAEWLKHKS